MAGYLLNTMSASDTTGIYINGATNDYTGTSDNYGIRIARDITTTAGNTYFVSYGTYNKEVIDAPLSGTGATRLPSNFGAYNFIEVKGAHSATPFAVFQESNYGLYNDIVRTGTLTSGGVTTTINNYGTYNSARSSVTYNNASGNSALNVYGTYSIVSALPTLTAGSMTANAYGEYISVTGNTQGTSTAYGLYIASVSGADNNYGIWDASGKNWILDGDNQKITLGEDQDANITHDGTNLRFEYGATNTSIAWFSGNISATGFNQRTSVYDKSKGNALDKIKDADDYKTAGEIDHSKFYGYTTYEVTDYDNCRDVGDKYCWQVNNQTICEEEVPEEIKDYTVIYRKECGTKTEGAVSLNAEIDVLRQAVYELKTELCKKDNSYDWC